MVTRKGKRRTLPVLLALLALVFTPAVAVIPSSIALAVPDDLGSKSRQAAEVAREIDSLDKQLAAATEAYNRVRDELNNVAAKVDETRKRLYEIKETLRQRRGILNERATALYKNGRTSMLEVLLDTRDFSDFLQRADFVFRVTESDARLISRIKVTRDSVQEVERQLAEQQRQQEGLVQQEAAKKYQIEATLTERRNLLNGLNQDIQRLLAEQQRQQAVSDQALSQEAQNVLVNVPQGSLAKTALRYLGIPYHWAGAGPGECPTGEHRICFDCSGLTQYVYKLHGVSIPHNAAMQFNRAAKVTLSQARAGDLVFFGMPPHHVGMYLGNDMFVHAPRTGDVVKVTKLSSRGDTSGIGRFTK